MAGGAGFRAERRVASGAGRYSSDNFLHVVQSIEGFLGKLEILGRLLHKTSVLLKTQ
jgi:hypothetical protein